LPQPEGAGPPLIGETEVTGGGQIAVEAGAWTPLGCACAFGPAAGQVTRREIRREARRPRR